MRGWRGAAVAFFILGSAATFGVPLLGKQVPGNWGQEHICRTNIGGFIHIEPPFKPRVSRNVFRNVEAERCFSAFSRAGNLISYTSDDSENPVERVISHLFMQKFGLGVDVVSARFLDISSVNYEITFVYLPRFVWKDDAFQEVKRWRQVFFANRFCLVSHAVKTNVCEGFSGGVNVLSGRMSDILDRQNDSDDRSPLTNQNEGRLYVDQFHPRPVAGYQRLVSYPHLFNRRLRLFLASEPSAVSEDEAYPGDQQRQETQPDRGSPKLALFAAVLFFLGMPTYWIGWERGPDWLWMLGGLLFVLGGVGLFYGAVPLL